MNIILRSRPLLIQHCFISCNFFSLLVSGSLNLQSQFSVGGGES